jgi:hypothetical protein
MIDEHRDRLVGLFYDTVSDKDVRTDDLARGVVRRAIVRTMIEEIETLGGATAVESAFVNTYYQICSGKLAGDDFMYKYRCVQKR